MKEIVFFAKAHGFNAVIVTNGVKVSDDDGEIIIKTLEQLKKWIGY